MLMKYFIKKYPSYMRNRRRFINGNCQPGSKYFLLFILFGYSTVSGQITDSILQKQVFDFTIRSEMKTSGGKNFLVLYILKNNVMVLSDSVITDKKNCTGFAIPETQPFKDYFIFSKHEKGNGKTYILSGGGEHSIISGGTFWAAPKHRLLFLLAERDLTNLVIYSLNKKKVLLEKFNCDEFDGWYYRHGAYMGSVTMECGLEPESEKELTEWMYPVEIEKYEAAKNNLYESHTNERELEKAKKLVRYASCK
jgi:hypothetical protein